MSQRNFVRLLALATLVLGLVLAVQAWAQTQQNRSTSEDGRVSFEGSIAAGADVSRMSQEFGDLIAGTAEARQPVTNRTTASGITVRPLSADRLNVAIAKPNGQGGFEVICEDGPKEARSALNRPGSGR